MRIRPILLCLLIVLPLAAIARPVAFYEGTGVMVENRAFQSEAMINYTFHPRWSGGVHYAQLREDDIRQNFSYGVLSFLPLRKNWEEWQANTYLTAGYGLREKNGFWRDSAYGALEGDIESRKYYFSAKAEGYDITSGESSIYARARGGFAPYLSEMNGLHTFILLQVDHTSWNETTDVTPLLRFFYQNVLFEIGMSVNGRSQLNFNTEF